MNFLIGFAVGFCITAAVIVLLRRKKAPRQTEESTYRPMLEVAPVDENTVGLPDTPKKLDIAP